MNVAFIGCGKLGLPCAEEIAKKGYTVTGYDITKVTSELVDIKPTIEQAVQDANIVFVAVPTPHKPEYDGRLPTAHLPPEDFSYDIVTQVLTETNKHMNKSQLLCLISTVIPGTVRSLLEPLCTNTRFVYNPYLIAMGSVAWDMVNPEMVMIGTEDGTETGDAKELVDFYKTIMENDPRYEIGTWDECECIKVFYNTFISAKLSLVNMIQDVAMKQGNINADVVCNALANSNKRIMGPQYMKPGMGDGGACHPRDNIALRHMAQKLELGYDLFGSIMNAREIQAENMAKFLVEHAKETELPVLIHGVAYKPNVEYLDGSYSILVAHYCEKLGYHPILVDPKTHPQIGPFKAVALLGHSAETTYRYTNQEYKDKLYCYLEPGSIIVDPWRKFDKNSNEYSVIYYGDTRYV
jgi:UDPglucose 6-dehydrogenase